MFLVALCLLPLLSGAAPSALFNFSSFTPNTLGINYSGDAYASGGGVIQLTRNEAKRSLLSSLGNAVYHTPVQLHDPATRANFNFTTHFKFKINSLRSSSSGDGLAFFISSAEDSLPMGSGGGFLGLFNGTTNGSAVANLVAIEFDTYKNPWDLDAHHIGINFNSVTSNVTAPFPKDRRAHLVTVGYSSIAGNISVYIDGTATISYKVNLSSLLPERVFVGFSSATGSSTELHQIISWDFLSSFSAASEGGDKPNEGGVKPNEDTRRVDNRGEQTTKETTKEKTPISWAIGVAVSAICATAGAGCLLGLLWRRLRNSEAKEDIQSMDAKLEKGTGFSRRFTYRELSISTNNFSSHGKLGQGGFGEVYKGYLDGMSVAVKRMSEDSSQGRKEYMSEVTVISRLRHRNLVRLVGWCHEHAQFLLVYEYMPNGSLDSYLFGKRESLSWVTRFQIARGLAAGLLYLHEEWEQCVVHRDVKSSNVMLDAGFNARLGDFGLARMVDHDTGGETTVLAGTMGYLAPECILTGRASKESDVFSFGVVALEIACGRKPVVLTKEWLVEWVWGLYGKRKLAEAVDERLEGVFDAGEMERLMVVGLWCAHPDCEKRPAMREAIQVLEMRAGLPSLPKALPRPVYFSPVPDGESLWTGSFGGDSGAARSDMGNVSSSSSSSSTNYSHGSML